MEEGSGFGPVGFVVWLITILHWLLASGVGEGDEYIGFTGTPDFYLEVVGTDGTGASANDNPSVIVEGRHGENATINVSPQKVIRRESDLLLWSDLCPSRMRPPFRRLHGSRVSRHWRVTIAEPRGEARWR